MLDKTRTAFVSLTIIMVLVFSAVSPKTAYADDGTTSGETSTEVIEEAQTDGGDEGVPAEGVTDSQPTEETAPVVDEGTSSESALDSLPGEEAAPVEGEVAPDPDAGILEGVPENTDVTVLDANGEAQPLATQAAVDAIATSDPIWCPGSQAPTPGQNGCTGSFTSFNELLTFMSGNTTFQGAGTIYVQQGVYQGSDPNNVIDFNNYDLSNIRNFNLSVTGGWNTSTNAIEPNTPTTFSNYSIIIGSNTNRWGGSLTVSNIVVSESPNNGIELYSDGDINVGNSRFERNRQAGAVIRAGRNVNVRNSVFGNGETFTTRVQMTGLDIESGDSTSLFGVIANDNYTFGTNINAGGRVTIGSSFFSGNSDILGTPSAPEFVGYGLQVVTPDAIDIANVIANRNYLWGAKLNAGGEIAILDSVFNENSTDQPGFIDDTGLFITGGANVALDNVTANNNRLYGAQIKAGGRVDITNSNFNDNRGVTTIGGVTQDHGIGLQINTLGDIFINNTNATNNTLFGGELTTTGGQVAVDGGSFSNISTDPTITTNVGLKITSSGDTSLANVVLDNNQTVGADIQAGGAIFLDNVTATDNGTDGVVIRGACTHLNGGQYSRNGQYGLNLGASALDRVSPATFTGNGVGDIFPDNPVTCPPAVSSSATPANNSAGSFNLFAGNFTSATAGSGISSSNESLNSYLAITKTGSTSSYGIFIGKYFYMDTLAGLQIFALVPGSQFVAMGGS